MSLVTDRLRADLGVSENSPGLRGGVLDEFSVQFALPIVIPGFDFPF
jgi:hypothetical protein